MAEPLQSEIDAQAAINTALLWDLFAKHKPVVYDDDLILQIRCGDCFSVTMPYALHMAQVIGTHLAQPRSEAADQHNAETGACMCQSTSHDYKDGRVKCTVCDHIAHGTRQHCGALR